MIKPSDRTKPKIVIAGNGVVGLCQYYAKLFELDPSVKPLFNTNMKEQGKKLMQMLAACVAGLDNLELTPAVQALGRRHVDYAVEDKHYDTEGAALLSTLKTGLGDQCTPEVEEAWASVYVARSEGMKTAAAQTA